MIQMMNVSKTFYTDNGFVHAVKNVSLNIEKGEIFGIIGYSGAGKSTLVRCINLLERPTEGQMIVGGKDLVSLPEKALRKEREYIGMIFQQFNLLGARTVFENVAFPLRWRSMDKAQITARVKELLKLVGIEDKEKAYPSQLSGGQKQRVAIARALANEPNVLLCDEATSALDPLTTQSILRLLKDVNKKLGITVVIITHEMAVIKEICDRVAVMEDGYVVEVNDVATLFSDPQQEITKHFINTTSSLSKIDDLIAENVDLVQIESHQQLLRIDFSGSETKEAMISFISRTYDVDASIIFANVEVIQGHVIGALIVILSGSDENQQKAIDFLQTQGMKVRAITNG